GQREALTIYVRAWPSDHPAPPLPAVLPTAFAAALCSSFLLAMSGHAGPIQIDFGVTPLVLRISCGQEAALVNGRRACRADLSVSNRASDGNHGQPESRDGRCPPELRRGLGE